MSEPIVPSGRRWHRPWHRVGSPSGWRSRAVTAVIVGTGLAWLGWPIWDSVSNPGLAELVARAPWLAAALVVGLVTLAVALWRDAGCRTTTLGAVAVLVLGTCVVRAVLSPGEGGVEFVHALPLLAGIALGGPAGFLTGATAALVSTVLVGVPAETLPMQALVWGLVGLSGSALSWLRPTTAWLCAVPLAVVAGVGSGVLLNLMGWGSEPGVSPTHFHPGLPPLEAARRLWAYTRETSLALDATRGVTTALVVLAVGRPVIVALRALPTLRGVTTPAPADLAPHALARREDRDRLDRLWN
ncbi:hypothetical protein [Nocardioides yefusunii]|uniref:ECF transporter S component n=1 Tax=Nocardioides yefusunii TaxID=2500546 RepID=A0ABW1QS41_9ACTN|nr:hypothetical protein [Nocardioides yefusunii]